MKNSMSFWMVRFSSNITILLLIMLLMHLGTVSLAMELVESKDQTTTCTFCDECPNPCPMPSPPPPFIECPPPPSPPPPPVIECPPPPSPPSPVLPECPPPPPASPCQDGCSQSPPKGSGVPTLIPNNRPPYVPNNPDNSMYPPNVYPVYYYNPPRYYSSDSIDLKMQLPRTVTSMCILFSTTFLISCFF